MSAVNETRVYGPAEIVALAVYRLGFTPTQSLVVIGLNDAHQAGVVARVDLADLPGAFGPLLPVLRRNGATSTAVVLFTEDPTTAAGTAVGAREVLAAAGIAATAVVQVGAGRYVDLLDPAAEPRPLGDVQGTVVAATFTAAGVAPLASRQALAPAPASGPARAVAVARAAQVAGTTTPEAVVTMWWAAAGPEALTARTCGDLAAGLAATRVRDAVLLAMCGADRSLVVAVATGRDEPGAVSEAMRGLLSPGGHRPPAALTGWVRALEQVVAHVDGHDVAAPAWTLLALARWWQGNGAATDIAVRRALDLRPEYRLARLIDATVQAGLGPGWTR